MVQMLPEGAASVAGKFSLRRACVMLRVPAGIVLKVLWRILVSSTQAVKQEWERQRKLRQELQWT